MAVVAYGLLVPRALLDALPFVNLHPSALPHWRGAAPIERALMAGEGESAVAAMLLVEALDAGPVAALERFAVGPDDDAGAVYERALALGLPPLARALADAASGGSRPCRRSARPPTPPRSWPPTALLDPARPARELHDRVRALSPHIGARLAARRRAAHDLAHGRARRRARRPGILERDGGALVARLRHRRARAARAAGARAAGACLRPTGCAACAARCPATSA